MPGNQRGGYRPGRDDTRWSKLERDLAAERRQSPPLTDDQAGRELVADWALITFEPELEASADLNERYAGRWHVWFVAQGTDTVEWLARPAGQGEPLLSAPTSGELAGQIDEAERCT
jgi:hypothetical protein